VCAWTRESFFVGICTSSNDPSGLNVVSLDSPEDCDEQLWVALTGAIHLWVTCLLPWEFSIVGILQVQFKGFYWVEWYGVGWREIEWRFGNICPLSFLCPLRINLIFLFFDSLWRRWIAFSWFLELQALRLPACVAKQATNLRFFAYWPAIWMSIWDCRWWD
jgi:hypothetical protein